MAFFADRLAGRPRDFIYVDEIQDVAEIADLKLSRSRRWPLLVAFLRTQSHWAGLVPLDILLEANYSLT